MMVSQESSMGYRFNVFAPWRLCVSQGKGTRFIKEALNRIEEENSDKKDILVTSAIQL